jgi:hypothetical protein
MQCTRFRSCGEACPPARFSPLPPASNADATATALQKSWGQSNITNLRLWFACEQHVFKLLRNWNPSTTTSSHMQEAFLSLAAVAAPLDSELSPLPKLCE